MILRLKGKTKKGKERVRRWGKHWRVMRNGMNVDICQGPAMLIASVTDESGNFPESTRWLAKTNDSDFEIEGLWDSLNDVPGYEPDQARK